MHEMALAQSIVELVEEHARRDAFEHVRIIRLSIGVLSHVDPRALETGLEVASRASVAEGARLVIERPGGQAWCTSCNATVEIGALGDPCPRCAGYEWLVTGGNEMRVVDLEVD